MNCTSEEIDSGGSQEPCRSFENEKGGGLMRGNQKEAQPTSAARTGRALRA